MPLRLLRLGNPFVRAVLSSPAHRLLSGSLLLLRYRGRRSGRGYAIPVMYAEDGERVLVLASRPARKQWWRTFRSPVPAALRVRGTEREVVGHLLDGDERAAGLRAWLTRFPRAAGPLGADAGAGRAALDAVDAAVVVFEAPPAGTHG